MSDLTILGNTVREPGKRLEAFEAPSGVSNVVLKSEELTALCPVTGQPDFYAVEISYAPNGKCLESKSLKLYLWSFRNEQTFCEALADRIAQDVFDAIKPDGVYVTLTMNPRGGIAIVANAGRYNSEVPLTRD